MSAPRISQFLPLRQLSRSALQGTRQRRDLHMTDPKDASPALGNIRPVGHLPAGFAALRAEARNRGIDTSGSKNDLIARLRADDVLSSRGFSTAAATAAHSAAASTASTVPTPPQSRQFNTSRELKAVRDTSTIDFAYFPDFTYGEADVVAHYTRIPIIPNLENPASLPASADDMPDAPVMKPQIQAASLDSVVFPMTEVHDNAAMEIDFTKFGVGAK